MKTVNNKTDSISYTLYFLSILLHLFTIYSFIKYGFKWGYLSSVITLLALFILTTINYSSSRKKSDGAERPTDVIEVIPMMALQYITGIFFAFKEFGTVWGSVSTIIFPIILLGGALLILILLLIPLILFALIYTAAYPTGDFPKNSSSSSVKKAEKTKEKSSPESFSLSHKSALQTLNAANELLQEKRKSAIKLKLHIENLQCFLTKESWEGANDDNPATEEQVINYIECLSKNPSFKLDKEKTFLIDFIKHLESKEKEEEEKERLRIQGLTRIEMAEEQIQPQYYKF